MAASELCTQKSSSSLASTSTQWKYDVFLSFRIEDTQKNFTDHLYAALDQKGIYTYERLEQGNEVSSECLEAIEQSRFSIIILSKHYASSLWCLDELARIVECMEMKNHTVFPVFYDIDPSEVRKQQGNFKKAFDKHEEFFSKDKVQRWKEALTQVANLSGWHLQGRHEAILIKDIVELTLKRLNRTVSSVVGDQLVGIDSLIEEIIYEYLKPELEDDIRFVGIWGMGGIGKTTIARVVYKKLSDHYDGRCFLTDVREESERKGVVYLQEMLLSKVLQETNLNICDDHEGANLIRRRLCHKRVFIVLDDVDDQLKQLEKLAGNPDWFGSGSRIIVTTRNKHVCISHGINNIYKVEALNHGDALKLFHLKAFKYKQPSNNHLKLSNSVINLAKGLPLALEVLGSFLCDQNDDEWKIAFNGLHEVINQKVLKILRISYDGLEKIEKKIFLDIVCFFEGKDKDRVTELLNSFYPDIGLKVLIEKSLVTISNNKLSMHGLIQEMGWEIVREQHRNEPGKWSRLWLCKDVYHVLTTNMGTQAVEGIMLDKPKQEIIHLSSNSFSTMRNLRFLKISNVKFSDDLEYLSDELRYLKWHGYPLKSLPSSFEPKHLFKLDMCSSNIQYLWKGIKHFEELKTIKLKYSHNLVGTPDFTGLKNLERLDLQGCTRLLEVHPSIGFLKQLTVLNMKDCKNLMIFPSNISGLKSLKILNLYGCIKLDKLPHNLVELGCLEELDVGGTAIQLVPSSIVQLTNLQKLHFSGCKGKHPKTWSSSLRLLLFPKRNLDYKGLLLPPLVGLSFLKTLDLSDCNLLEGAIPNDLGSLVSLEELKLGRNKFVSLPASISNLPKLKILCLEKCQRLQSLPQLPPETVFVGAEDCTSLETMSNALELSTSHAIALHFFNCNKLVENHLGRKNSLAVVLLQSWLQKHSNPSQFHIRLPGSDIPEWFDNWSNASSAEISLSPNWLNDEFMGFSVCAVFAISDHSDEEIHCAMTIKTGLFKFSFAIPGFTTVDSDHLWLAYLSRCMFESGSRDWLSTSKHVRAHFLIIGRDKKEWSTSCVKSCGIRLVYKGNVEYYFEESSGSDSAITVADDQQNYHNSCNLEWMSFTEIHMPDILQRSSIRKPYSRMQQIFDDEQENKNSNQVHDFNDGKGDGDGSNEDSYPAKKRRNKAG